MSLSQYQITNAKPAERSYKLYDEQTLYLTIQPTGGKLWRMNYRHLGRQKTLHLGRWPQVGLAEARERRDQARKLLAAGLDPALEKQKERMLAKLAADNTFRGIAEEFVQKCEREGKSPVTIKKIRWSIDKANPMMGRLPIATITPHQVLAVLKKEEATGHYESACRLRSVIGRVFRYAIATARADRDVATDLRGAIATPKVTHLAAITTPEEAGRLLRSIDRYTGKPTTLFALKLSAHLFVRPGELRAAEWSEIDWRNAIWSIPAAKMKMRRPHRVPLSRQVQELIVELHALTGRWKYLFPSPARPKNCLSENTVNLALRRMGYGADVMTAHGFRAMAATLLNESGRWHPDAIERQLAHLDRSEVRRAYTRGEYWAERIQMMQFWSDYIDELRLRGTEEESAAVPNFMMLSGVALLEHSGDAQFRNERD